MHAPDINSRQLVREALAGQETPRPATGPLAVHFTARLAGVTLRSYTTDARVLADCIVRYYETFQPDAVWVSADTWVTAEAMGARVRFPGDNQPMAGTGEPLIKSPSDIEGIPPPDPTSQGRWPLMIEALERVVEVLGKRVFIVACFDQFPFSLACALMGIQQVMLALHDRSEVLEALMDRCVEYALAYGRAMAAAGADMLSGGDSPAGLIGPERYRQVAWPAEKRVIEGIKSRTDIPVSLHVCGDATPLLADLARTGADVLELDHQVDMTKACGMVGPDVAIWGNLDPVGVLVNGSVPEVREATRRLVHAMRNCRHNRFVVSSGCTLAVETPFENLRAMLTTAMQSE